MPKLTAKQFDDLRNEVGDLVYGEPQCDFEHAWNCAIDKADECFNGWGEEEE